jgi:hypothetical protein
MRLDGGLLHLLELIGVLEDMGRLLEAFLDIANIGSDGDHQVAAGILDANGIRFIVDDRGTWVESLLRLEDCRQELIVHLDQV